MGSMSVHVPRIVNPFIVLTQQLPCIEVFHKQAVLQLFSDECGWPSRVRSDRGENVGVTGRGSHIAGRSVRGL